MLPLLQKRATLSRSDRHSVLWPALTLLTCLVCLHTARAGDWDSYADTWVATDSLGRSLPGPSEAGPPRLDRTVGIFYFLWLGPHSQKGGPWDITKILAQDPAAMQKPDSPLWGPMFAPHHWGESIFGYYNTDDPYVLRKHAQMLSDAGVDMVVFDVTNQQTYRSNYLALLRTWAAVRALGNKTPQVAFLCPFWDPAKVVRELYRDLYKPGVETNLWFRWQGKPLILADPDKLGLGERFAERNNPAELKSGMTLGQSFRATNNFAAVGGSFPTWSSRTSAMTLQLRQNGPEGAILATHRFQKVGDNDWLLLRTPSSQPAGEYYLEMIDPSGQIGWWSHHADCYPSGEAFMNGKAVPGDRNLQILYADSEAGEIQNFFTFRRPQADYFRGQTAPDMWSWLEKFPQHVFTNSLGQKEQMSIGVAQNAVSNRLGSMSEPGSLGRNYHSGELDSQPGAVNWGFNFAEQFERALREDPRFLFITGWNEWIAGRHPEFNGIRQPVMFVDQFDQEHSRDIEPMQGGHGDNYYYQMAALIRRYKGVRNPPVASPQKKISITEGFEQWSDVTPEYRDDIGDTAHRDFPGYAHHTQYKNASGRNDIVAAKVARDANNVYFYVRTREPLSDPTGTNWMWLLMDIDNSSKTGWEGYDLIINRTSPEHAEATVEKNAGDWNWEGRTKIQMRMSGNEMHLAVPRSLLQSRISDKLRFNFKWADNMPQNGDIVSWLDSGDSAPNGRFAFHFEEQ
ncbi:MAG: hypothetical protein JWM99_2750 [Verrucomicrobiales bacterium]|nr:hypothetical protein [Verrucomicrobiales bacterium]